MFSTLEHRPSMSSQATLGALRRYRVSNKGRGSQTLNHVLDSLLGTSTHGRSHDLAAFVKVTFRPGNSRSLVGIRSIASPPAFLMPRSLKRFPHSAAAERLVPPSAISL